MLILLFLLNLIPYFKQQGVTENKGGPSLWQVINWQTTILFGFIASILSLFQAIFNSVQKFKELRWNKAQLATTLTDSVYNDILAHDALKMIDGSKKVFSDKNFRIDFTDVKNALLENDQFGKSIYIRECFDTLFYYFERIEHSIKVGVVKIEDINAYFAYYLVQIKSKSEVLIQYAEAIKYENAVDFMSRE